MKRGERCSILVEERDCLTVGGVPIYFIHTSIRLDWIEFKATIASLATVSIFLPFRLCNLYHTIMAAVESVPSPAHNPTEEGTQNPLSMAGGPDISILTDLNDSRIDLLDRIHSLKNDLQDWRGKLDTQVKTYRQELGDLKTTLNDEVDQLKSEFQELRNSLLKQLDDASKITSLISNVPKKAEEEASVLKIEE